MHTLRHMSGRCAVALSLLLICVVTTAGCGPTTVKASDVRAAATPSLAGHGVTMTTFTQTGPAAFEGTGKDSKGDACRVSITVSGGMLRYQVNSDVRASAAGGVSATSSTIVGTMPYR